MLGYGPESNYQSTDSDSRLQHHQQQQQQQPSSYIPHENIPALPLQKPLYQPRKQYQFNQIQSALQAQTPIQSQNSTSSTFPPTPYSTSSNYCISNLSNFGLDLDRPTFDFPSQQQQYPSNYHIQPRTFMPATQSNTSWMSNGQLTPTPISRPHHHRESSLSSLGSPAAPASPFAPSTSNPQVAGDSYHELHEYSQTAPKSLTPTDTPSHENFLLPLDYTNCCQSKDNLSFMMANNDGFLKSSGGNELMSAPDFHSQGSSRPSITTVASHDSPSTPPSYENSKQQSGMTFTVDSWLNDCLLSSDSTAHRSATHQIPKLARTITDSYTDELFHPSYSSTVSVPSTTPALTRTVATPGEVAITRALQAANSSHLDDSSKLTPRERSPFQPGSPLAPTSGPYPRNNFLGTAQRMREEQKAKADALAMQEQMQFDRNEDQGTPKTISPKDVDLVYHESEEDASNPLFSPRQPENVIMDYRQHSMPTQEPSELEHISLSQQSCGSMATTRRESSSAHSTNSQSTSKQEPFNFATPAASSNVRQVPQQYPFIPTSQRQTSNMSNQSGMSNDFPPNLASMESSSDYSSEHEGPQKPPKTLANSGTYTCTYHGCTLRFETPAMLQKHKREGHRNSISMISSTGGANGGSMTSVAQKLNSQSGPHRCEQKNPSTGKACNTVFSRPYDLTRHEDTIHNGKKQKLRCKYCTEEKTFSRNDALTRHLRVVHPEIPVANGKGRRRGMGLNME